MLSEQINSEVKNFQDDPVLVLTGNSWHEGIIGIVASRIKEKYNKPTILILYKRRFRKGISQINIWF